ncbi:hypothetical protein Tco_1506890 [Tanacetum coccineum]
MVKRFVHQPLVCDIGVLQPERHLGVKEYAMASMKGNFFLILFCHLDLGIAVFRTCFVEVGEVHTYPPIFVMLLDQNWIRDPAMICGISHYLLDIQVDWYGYFPKDIRRSSCPKGQVISPENPINGTVVGTKLRFTSGLNLRKQCSYRIFEALPPSTYILFTICPSTSSQMIMGSTSSSNHSRADPNKIELNMWHQVGIAHLSTLVAVVKVLRRSSGSPVPSYIFMVMGIQILFGKKILLILLVKGVVDSLS